MANAYANMLMKFTNKCKCPSETSLACKSTPNSDNPQMFVEKSFQSLTLEEKQKIQKDLYGDGDQPIEESMEFVNEKLQELQRELNKLNSNFKKAYTKAMDQEKIECEAGAAPMRAASDKQEINKADIVDDASKKEEEEDYQQHDYKIDDKQHYNKKDTDENFDDKRYVSSPQFLLMFLRSERFNTCSAARRLARYFKEKLDLFGNEKLSRRILQSDLDEQDLSALRSGRFVIPGITDEAGRLLIVACQNWYQASEKCINMKRAIFYLFSSWLENHQESQKKGVVFIVWHIHPSSQPQQQRSSPSSSLFDLQSQTPLVAMMQRVIPMQIAAAHVCYNNFTEKIVINFFFLVLPTHIRRRHVLHYDQPDACILNMIPYGIHFDALPFLAEDGNFKQEDTLQYLDLLLH